MTSLSMPLSPLYSSISTDQEIQNAIGERRQYLIAMLGL